MKVRTQEAAVELCVPAPGLARSVRTAVPVTAAVTATPDKEASALSQLLLTRYCSTTDFKFIGKVESQTNDFYKTSVHAHFT